MRLSFFARLCVALTLAVAALGPFVRTAHADERADALRDRIQMIRKLPPEEQQRLRAALQRFKSLSEEQRGHVRACAERVGKERLQELVGRDVERLRKRQTALDRERTEILRLLGGRERFATLSEVERQYVAGLAVRSFQKHVRRTLLDIGGPNEMNAFSRLAREERRAKLETAVRQLEESLIQAETPESQAAIRALPPGEQRHRRHELLAEHRMSLIPSFVTAFEHQRVRPFLLLPPEKRQSAAAEWAERARWFEMRKRLEQDVGVSSEALRLLVRLGAEDWARLRDEYDRTQTMGAVERRLHLENEIRELHGRAALSSDANRRGGGRGEWGRLRSLMRDEMHHRRAPGRRERDPGDRGNPGER